MTESHPGFFERAEPMPLSRLAPAIGAELKDEKHGSVLVHDLKPLASAGAGHLSYCESRKYLRDLASTGAGACLVVPEMAERVPAATVPLLTRAPPLAFAKALGLYYADGSEAMRRRERTIAQSPIHPSAVIGEDVIVEPGAIVGPEARIGSGTIISSGAVIGFRVVVGRDCRIGPCASMIHAIVGDRVIVHQGARLGQDGFGFVMSAKGHTKIRQIGRLIIGNDVEIGANTTIDRGALEDTVIGEGTKIDNLVHIAHNVKIGRYCLIAGQCGISGSATLGDLTALGGQVGVKDHVKIGSGVQLAARAGVINDLPSGATYGGWPARPFKEWAREVAAVSRLASRSS
jgi:UDP-3-O-[3-hydroxymyristoyl] glucosamine N-acyltransferase